MADDVPQWINALSPKRSPYLESVRPGSDLSSWHVEIQLDAWELPVGRILRGSDNWNGKALVKATHHSIDRSVGEVEIVERIRLAFPNATVYWTAGKGNPPEIWRPWALRSDLRGSWFTSLENKVRREVELISGNEKGTPDVLWWESGSADIHAVEYKGPSPSNPRKMDVFSEWQEAWLRSALLRGLLDRNRFAIAYWSPSANDQTILAEQAAASRAGRDRKRCELSRVT